MNKNINTHGGGVQPSRKPAPEVIAARARLFVTHRLHSDTDHLDPQERMKIVYVLFECFSFSVPQILPIFSRARSNIYSDLSRARFFYSRSPAFRGQCADIYDYLIYNSRYIH